MVSSTGKTLTVLTCVLAAAPALAADKIFDKHFAAVPGGQLTLTTDVGSVVVVGHDDNDVVVHVVVSGPNDFLSRLDVQAVQDAGDVNVTGRLGQPAWFEWWFGFGSGQHQVHYTIDVPHSYPVDIHTSGGRLEVRNLNASVRATTSGGSITIRDVRGALDTRTSGGRIEATNLSGTSRLRTGGGSVEVDDSSGDLDVSTSGGRIRLEGIDGKVRASTAGGHVDAEIRVNRGISLATSGGSIDLLLPANANGSIDAHASAGRVESAIALSSTEIVRRNELRGTINGGGEPISLRTSGGSIHIRPLD